MLLTKYTFWTVWDAKTELYLQHDGKFGTSKSAMRFSSATAALCLCKTEHHRAVQVEQHLKPLRIAKVQISDFKEEKEG